MFGDNDRLTSLHMDKLFIWLEETCERMNEFDTGYMINPSLHVNKEFKEQVEIINNTIFGELTQPFIKAKLSKKNKCVSINNVL